MKMGDRRRKAAWCGSFIFTWGTVNAKRRKYKFQTTYHVDNSSEIKKTFDGHKDRRRPTNERITTGKTTRLHEPQATRNLNLRPDTTFTLMQPTLPKMRRGCRVLSWSRRDSEWYECHSMSPGRANGSKNIAILFTKNMPQCACGFTCNTLPRRLNNWTQQWDISSHQLSGPSQQPSQPSLTSISNLRQSNNEQAN